MNKLLKPASIAFYFLMFFVFFIIGIYVAGAVGAGKNQMLAGGAIVIGWGVMFAGIAFIASFFIARYVAHKIIVRLNWLLLIIIAIAYGVTHYNYLERQKEKADQTIANEKGTLVITTTNNGNNWDCKVKVLNEKGMVRASVRTYQNHKEVKVNPGTYKVTIQALGSMEGLETYSEIENTNIIPGGITHVSYDFKTGDFEIYTKVGGENIDCLVTIKEINSGKNIVGSRTYTKGAKIMLNLGTYQVKVKPLGNHREKNPQTFTIKVKQGEMTTKEINF